MPAATTIQGLSKVFRVARRPEGSLARRRSVFRRRWRRWPLTGILHPSAGHATVLGLVPWRQRRRLAFRIGSVIGQRSQLWLHLPPVDTFAAGGRSGGGGGGSHLGVLRRGAALRVRQPDANALLELNY